MASLEDVERIEGLLREDEQITGLYGTNSAMGDGQGLVQRRNAFQSFLRRDPSVPPPSVEQLEQSAMSAFAKLAEAVRNDPNRIA